MSDSMRQRKPSMEGQSLDAPRPTMANASLKRPRPSSSVHEGPLDRLSRTVKVALVQAHGSGQAAAITIAIDQSDMNRRLQIGTLDLRALAAGGEQALAILGDLLQQEFGEAKKSKRQLAIERIPELLALMLDAVRPEGE